MASMPQLILVPPKDLATPSPADKMSSLKSEAEKLQKDLDILRSETQHYLEEKHKDNTEYLPTIRNAIAFLPASTRVEQIPLFGWKQQTEISSAPSFASVFGMFKRICHFPDSSLLEHLVRLFGSEQIQKKMLSYMERLRSFRSRTKVSDFTKVCTLDSSLPLEFSILTIKIGREWHRSTLEDIEQLRQSMVQKASLTSYGMRLLQVEWEQGLLHWCIPSRALQSLVGSLDSEFLQENHVEILSINGTHLQSTQSAGVTTLNSLSSPGTNSSGSPTPVSAGHSKGSSSSSLLPVSPTSATGGQTGQPLSLQDQLAMVGAQVVQFKPAVPAPASTVADTKQQMLSPTTLMTRSHNPQPTAIQIVHPHGVQSSSGRLATVPVMSQHPGSQQIQIIHPQIIQPSALQTGGGNMGKHMVQSPQVIVRGKPETEGLKSADVKPSLTPDGYMVMQGGPNGNSLVLVPSYVMVNSGAQQKLSSPPSSSVAGASTTIFTSASPDRKSTGGIATLLQPGTPTSSLFSVSQQNSSLRGLPPNPVTASVSPVFTLAPGQSKIYENPIFSMPNPAISSSSSSSSAVGSLRPLSASSGGGDNHDMGGRHGAQLKSLNHICTICGNGYMWASSLKRHMHTHTAEGGEQTLDIGHPPPDHLQEPPSKRAKSIECQICHQLVESPAAYTRHLRLHMKMHRRRENARGAVMGTEEVGRQHGGGEGEVRENGDEEGGEEGEGAGEDMVEGGGEGEVDRPEGERREGAEDGDTDTMTVQPKKEDTCSSSSGSDHSSDSASETEDSRETAEPAAQQMNTLPTLVFPGDGSSPQEPSTGTSQESASLPNSVVAIPGTGSGGGGGGLPFNQLLQYVGTNKDSEESAEDGATDHDSTTPQTTSRRFRCDECGRYLSSQAALSGHQQCMHNKQKPHICHICNKGFFQSHSLTVHLRSHSGEKPYSCIVCNKSFSQRSSLNIHIRTHSGERPYQCPFCSRGFSDSSTLAKHRRTHTGERPYQCRECGASFSQSGNLWRHMKQVHPSAAVTT